MSVLITVDAKGNKRYGFTSAVPMPAGKKRDVKGALYPFNDMVVGDSLPELATDVLTDAEVKKMTQAFKSEVYSPAQANGSLSARRVSADGFRIWMVPKREKKAKAEVK